MMMLKTLFGVFGVMHQKSVKCFTQFEVKKNIIFHIPLLRP